MLWQPGDAWHDFHYNLHGEDVEIIPQGDGSAYQWLNCACATAAEHILSECQGKRPPGIEGAWPPNGALLRRYSGDTSGGLSAAQIDATSNRYYDVDPDFAIVPSSKVLAWLRSGYFVTQLRWEGPIVDAGFVGSPGFRENHSSGLAGARGSGASIRIIDCNPLYDGRRAGIPQGPQLVPWRAIVRSSEQLRLGSGRLVDRYGAGMMYVGRSRIPYRPAAPVVSIRYSVVFGGGDFYIYRVANGAILSRARHEALSKPTSAPCSAPRAYTWAGRTGRWRLVRITDGVLQGQYVAVPQGSVTLREKEVRA